MKNSVSPGLCCARGSTFWALEIPEFTRGPWRVVSGKLWASGPQLGDLVLETGEFLPILPRRVWRQVLITCLADTELWSAGGLAHGQ